MYEIIFSIGEEEMHTIDAVAQQEIP